MRVIAGKAKGHHLKFASSARLRPTSDMVKGAIFSALDSMEVDYATVLDLYAGTGALGIEALSRGADIPTSQSRHISIAPRWKKRFLF